MNQYTETYRIKITPEMREKLTVLKVNYHICPAKFIRQAINEKFLRDIPTLKEKTKRIFVPF